jgi:hypothetical protein
MSTRWPMLRVLLTAHLSFALIAWSALVVLTAVVTAGATIWTQIDRSFWHYPATFAARWFAFGLGVDAVTTYLRLHVAHGRTRRDFLRQLWPHLLVLSAFLALLVAIGYLVEGGVYALMDWPRQLPSPALFGTADNLPGVIGAFMLMFVLWAVAGVLLAAAFTRNFVLGLITVPFGLLIITPSELVAGTTAVPLIQDVMQAMGLPTAMSIGLGLVGIVVGGAAIWGIVRDMPVRPRVA